MSESTPLISIIVPVYNVEAYVEKCLASLANQTYRNIEVILVDDASTDGSKDICRRFVEADSRFRLYEQKENGGISVVRNKALSEARGEWIGFADSDDWVDEDMFETLYRAQQETGADIVQCAHFYHRTDGTFSVSRCKTEKILNTNEALEMLFRDREVKNYVWDKLFARNLFKGVTFPEGRNFEDVAIMFRLFSRARKVKLLAAPKYHYVMRENSIIHSRFSVEKELDFLMALNEQLRFARSNGLWKDADSYLAKIYLRVITRIQKSGNLNRVARIKAMLRNNVVTQELLSQAPYLAVRRFLCLYYWDGYVWINRYCYQLKNKKKKKNKN